MGDWMAGKKKFRKGLFTKEKTFFRKGPSKPRTNNASLLPLLGCIRNSTISRAGCGCDPSPLISCTTGVLGSILCSWFRADVNMLENCRKEPEKWWKAFSIWSVWRDCESWDCWAWTTGGLGGFLHLYKYMMEGVKKMELDFSEWCTVTGQKATDTK